MLDLIVHEPQDLFTPREELVVLLAARDVVEIVVEKLQPVLVVSAAVVEHAARNVYQETVPEHEIGAVYHPLQEEPPVTVEVHLFQVAGELALRAEGFRIASEGEGEMDRFLFRHRVFSSMMLSQLVDPLFGRHLLGVLLALAPSLPHYPSSDLHLDEEYLVVLRARRALDPVDGVGPVPCLRPLL